jgi:hypothetical protein
MKDFDKSNSTTSTKSPPLRQSWMQTKSNNNNSPHSTNELFACTIIIIILPHPHTTPSPNIFHSFILHTSYTYILRRNSYADERTVLFCCSVYSICIAIFFSIQIARANNDWNTFPLLLQTIRVLGWHLNGPTQYQRRFFWRRPGQKEWKNMNFCAHPLSGRSSFLVVLKGAFCHPVLNLKMRMSELG